MDGSIASCVQVDFMPGRFVFTVRSILMATMLIASCLILNTVQLPYIERDPITLSNGTVVRFEARTVGWPFCVLNKARSSRADVIGRTPSGSEIWNQHVFDNSYNLVSVARNCAFGFILWVCLLFILWYTPYLFKRRAASQSTMHLSDRKSVRAK